MADMFGLMDKYGNNTKAVILYMFFPIGVWAAIRFWQLGTTAITLIFTVFALYGSVMGNGPFVLGSSYLTLFHVNMFLSALMVMSLTLAATACSLRLVELKLATDAASKSERNLQAIMDNSPAVIYIRDRQGQFMYINRKFEFLTHVTCEDIIGKYPKDIFPEAVAEEHLRNDRVVLDTGVAQDSEESGPHDNGMHIYAATKFPLFDETGTIYAVCGISTDITERKLKDEQIRRSQKMDSLGKLTGGVAHDFNNILGIISGYAELISLHPTNAEAAVKNALTITNTAKRGTKLTQKLLSFSRHKQPDVTAVNINEILRDQEDMLKKTLTVRINFSLNLQDDLWSVKLDSSDLEDAIVNMSINALHAMNSGGQLTISTSNVVLDAINIPKQGLSPGDYVLLSITDTGCGIDPAIKERIFDPFFTTKYAGYWLRVKSSLWLCRTQ
ncbi:MAG: PAS domain-containing protein [Pseudomonadales bacterium]|nr:PAS domain-containing protein [Pseudomonadales bacterium]